MNQPLRLLAIAAALLAPSAAGADWLVLKNGTRIETRGPVEIRGDAAVYRVRNGVLHTIRLHEVDRVETGAVVPRRHRGVKPIAGSVPHPPVRWSSFGLQPFTGASRTARVVEVIDGDTIRVEINGRRETVRIAGIDTPETNHPTKGRERLGAEATAFTQAAILGTVVRLYSDPRQPSHDRYGRRLAYVNTARGTDLGAELLQAGLATRYRGAECSRCDAYDQIERRAAQIRAGIWSSGAGQLAHGPSPASTSTVRSVAPVTYRPPTSTRSTTGSRTGQGEVRVRSYRRKDGTVVRSHTRSRPRR